MKYTVVINQLAFHKYFPDLDIVDAAIFDYIAQFMLSKGIERLDDKHGRWYWVSYKKIADDMPIINIKTKDAIYRRVKKLIEVDLLEAHPNNKTLTRSYFKQGEHFDLINFAPPDEKPNPRMNNRGTPGQKTEVPSDEKSDDTIINDSTNTDKVYTSDKKNMELFTHPLVEHIEENYKRVARMENPLTNNQAAKIIKDYREKYPHLFPSEIKIKKAIDEVLKSLNNNKAAKRNISANETIRKWLNKKVKWMEEDQNAAGKEENRAINNALEGVKNLDFDD